LSERSEVPLGSVDPERLEQLALRERRKRLAEGALEADPERDDACGAVAERPLLPELQPEREREPVPLRVHELLVAGRRVVPVVALEAGAHRQQVAERDRRRRLPEQLRERRLDTGDDPAIDRDPEQHSGDGLGTRSRVPQCLGVAFWVRLDEHLAAARHDDARDLAVGVELHRRGP
jgi:hypothetical protein